MARRRATCIKPEGETCKICGATFRDKRGLRGHERLVHGVEKRILKDSEALGLLKEISAKVDRVLEALKQ